MFIGFGIASILTDPNKDGIDGIPDIPVNNSYMLSLIQNLTPSHLFRAMTTVPGSSTITFN